MLLVAPNSLRDAINKKLDEAFVECPEAEKDREELYRQLLVHFDEYGSLPDFKLGKRCGKCEGCCDCNAKS